MEAVTAVKIQIVYENPLTASNPLTPTASETKNAIRKGPVKAAFPEKTNPREVINNMIANPIAILEMFFFFIVYLMVKLRGKL